ncbi:MAG TPA: CNP1-like family protein [Burkholderiales bacterium]|nr:CNP1-like family protein [Burkholderiales bacterium]
MKAFRVLGVCLSLLLVCAWAAAAERGMPEDIGGIPEQKEFKEDALTLPSYPGDASLIEFRLRGATKHLYFIDRDSLSLGEDRVVRYTIVIKTAGGSTNVSYEGMRCKTSEYKVYAFGTRDGKWVQARDPEWKAVGATAGNFHFGLWVDYLCNSESVNGNNVEDLVIALKGNAPYRSNTTKN